MKLYLFQIQSIIESIEDKFDVTCDDSPSFILEVLKMIGESNALSEFHSPSRNLFAFLNDSIYAPSVRNSITGNHVLNQSLDVLACGDTIDLNTILKMREKLDSCNTIQKNDEFDNTKAYLSEVEHTMKKSVRALKYHQSLSDRNKVIESMSVGDVALVKMPPSVKYSLLLSKISLKKSRLSFGNCVPVDETYSDSIAISALDRFFCGADDFLCLDFSEFKTYCKFGDSAYLYFYPQTIEDIFRKSQGLSYIENTIDRTIGNRDYISFECPYLVQNSLEFKRHIDEVDDVEFFAVFGAIKAGRESEVLNNGEI